MHEEKYRLLKEIQSIGACNCNAAVERRTQIRDDLDLPACVWILCRESGRLYIELNKGALADSVEDVKGPAESVDALYSWQGRDNMKSFLADVVAGIVEAERLVSAFHRKEDRV